jgi:hypothetical protein
MEKNKITKVKQLPPSPYNRCSKNRLVYVINLIEYSKQLNYVAQKQLIYAAKATSVYVNELKVNSMESNLTTLPQTTYLFCKSNFFNLSK